MIKTSDLKGKKGWLIMITAALFSLVYLYFNSFGVLSTSIHRGLYFLFTGVLGILIYPTAIEKRQPLSIAADVLFVKVGRSFSVVYSIRL